MKPKRIVNKAVLKSAKQRHCIACGAPPPTDPHHIKSVGAGGDDTATNLLSLCRKCHTEIHFIGKKTFLNKYPWIAEAMARAERDIN
jgi:Putative HNHc nuclease